MLGLVIGHENCFMCVAGTLDKTEKIQLLSKFIEEDTSTRALIAKEVEIVSEIGGYHKHKWPCYYKKLLQKQSIMIGKTCPAS